MSRPHSIEHRSTAVARILLTGAAVLALVASVLGTAAPASAGPVATGHLDWGFKESFRKYVEGPIAKGDITVSGGATIVGSITTASGFVRFPVEPGGTRTSTTAAVVPLAGSVRFTGHAGDLDLTLSDLRVTISGSTGTLRADVVSKPLDEDEPVVSEDVAFATLAPVAGTVSGLTTTWSAVPTALSAQGATAFEGFYTAGQVLDPLTLSVTEAAATTTTTGAGTTSSTSSSTTSSTSPSTSTSTTSTSTSTSTSTTSTSTTVAVPAATVTGGRIDWGMKQTFRSYVVGPIAKGAIATAGGASVNGDGTFRFPVVAADARYGSPADVVAPASGEVRFSGHAGELDLRITDLQVQIEGDQAVLFADVSSLPLEAAEAEVFDDIGFADLDLAAAAPTANGSTVTWTELPATLTEDGAAAFAGFYAVGDPVDPVTLVLDLQGAAPGVPTTTSTSTVPDVTLSASTVAVGGSLTATAKGFLAGEQVQIWVHSTPTFAGLATADATGAVSQQLTLPASIAVGVHKVELRGLSSNRRVFSGDLVVTAPAGEAGSGATGGGIPRTGGEQGGLLALALVLLVSGVTLQVSAAARSRRPT